jgi:hypothetical protein
VAGDRLRGRSGAARDGAARDGRSALAGDGDSVSFEAEDGRYTLALKKIVFVKRYAREATVGFGAAA